MALRTVVAVWLGAALLAASPGPSARAVDAGWRAAAEGADCVAWEPRVVYGALGYDHLVDLRNGCDRGARCAVHTDVNPTPQEVAVARGASTTVVTFRGSPARQFEATVRCTLED